MTVAPISPGLGHIIHINKNFIWDETFSQCLVPNLINTMKATLLATIYILIFCSVFSQEKHSFSISANFGLNGSFFVASLDNDAEPAGSVTFNEKNFIGKAGGIEGRLQLSGKSHLSLGFTHSENNREYEYENRFNNYQVYINYFTIRHMENIFHFGYSQQLFRKAPGFRGEIGLFYSRQIQQSIDLFNSTVIIAEAKFNPGGLNELGAFIGFQYARKIDTKFELGIQSRFFYEITSNIFSQITLTPTLTYHFTKSKKKTT